jgi:ABC-type Na+ efflux pump permease subunit
MTTGEPVRAGGTPRFSTDLVFTVARREFLSTVRRKAFLLTLLGTPAYFAFVLTISSGSAKGERTEALQDLRSATSIRAVTSRTASRRSPPTSSPAM